MMSFVRYFVFAVLVLVAASMSHAQDAPVEPPPPTGDAVPDVVAEPPAEFLETTPEQIDAVTKGLDFIAKSQNRNTGSISASYPVAVTALCGLAFMANGSTPTQGKYSENVKKCINYILSCSNRKGFITEPNMMESRMHGHAYATLFLAEAYGMIDDGFKFDLAKIISIINKSIKVIESSQTTLGGWGYEPYNTSFDEGSVTICQVQALRACRNSGFKVEKKVIDKALEYIKKSANPDGSFKYSLSSGGGGGTAALTAAAVSTLNYLGVYDKETPELKKGLEFLKKNFSPASGGRASYYFYYGGYYATLAMYYTGDENWMSWFPQMRTSLLSKQSKEGSWSGEVSPEFSTALACLMLEIPFQYLPIFQR